VFSSARVGDRSVYLFRNAAEARAIIAEHALWRLAEIALLGMLATALINLLLIRLVIRPFTDLARTIRLIGNGRYGANTGTFHSREFQSLATDLNQMSLMLARAEHEHGLQMSKAGRLQHRLQSSGITVPGLKVVHWHEAADHVAGDYFDLLRCPDGSWLICIADVTGHGVAAAMGAAILKTLLWSAVESGGDLDQIVRSVNQRFSEVTLEEDFASLLLIRWSPESSELQYANAGHETAYLLHKGTTPQFMGSTGTLVGIARDHMWEIKNITIMPGSRLVLYTDGITEARSPDGKHFGRERLKRLIHDQSGYTVQDTIDYLVGALRSHLGGSPADDDLTLVGLEFIGNTESVTPQLCSANQDEG
jgi:sigma-B regulation protein RsbU (phosphoserine phosphatase)